MKLNKKDKCILKSLVLNEIGRAFKYYENSEALKKGDRLKELYMKLTGMSDEECKRKIHACGVRIPCILGDDDVCPDYMVEELEYFTRHEEERNA